MVISLCSLRHRFIFLISSCAFFILISCAANPTELAHQVCRNTTNYNFCVEALYSDPRAPTADRYVLAYISFDLAYRNATHTSDYIAVLLKNESRGRHELVRGLQRCRGYYGEAVRVLAEVINDLDSETFFELGRLAVIADHYARDCEASFNNAHSPLSSMNQNLRGLSKICGVVSKLFTLA